MFDLVMPSSIPCPEWDSLNWSPAFDGVVRSQFPAGMKTRRLVTAVPEIFSCAIYPTAAQLQVLLDFHDYTCAGGVLRFNWWDFRKPNDTTRLAEYQFQGRPTHGTWADIYRADLKLVLHRNFTGTFPLTDELGAQLETDTDEGLTT
ncbi:hypothetical protein [Stenotrophomonas sp. UBA7606]|uniref:hypothetical protein n=1 Tax=Stenotrophomonas sp. UBA7606 TaxID=1947559 RepID=UPI0025F4ECB3|nr:hypothetical protein [Stenotrophomonas sp. UBA7606]